MANKKEDYKKKAKKNKAQKNAASQKNSVAQAKLAELEGTTGKKYQNPAFSTWGKILIGFLVLAMLFGSVITLILYMIFK